MSPAVPRKSRAGASGDGEAAADAGANPTVLVAHDGSHCARVAADLAIQVARGCGLGVSGLFVVAECVVSATRLLSHIGYWLSGYGPYFT